MARDVPPDLPQELPKNPVVLVHGLWNTVDIFWRLRSHLSASGWSVSGFTITPNDGKLSIESQAQQLCAHIDHTFAATETIDIVGFSMGGLVSRYYLQQLPVTCRVQRLVTVATPHFGSALAWARWERGIRQMRPGSEFLRSLNRNLHQLKASEIISIWTPWDLLVIPATSCRLPTGKTICAPASSHNSLLREAVGLTSIAAALTEASPHHPPHLPPSPAVPPQK